MPSDPVRIVDGEGKAISSSNPLQMEIIDSIPSSPISEIGVNIAPKTLTAASPNVVPDPGDGFESILFELAIKNTDSSMRSVTITDGVKTFGTSEIEAKSILSISFWPLGTAWFGTPSAAIRATPSADNLLKVLSGKYLVQAANQ